MLFKCAALCVACLSVAFAQTPEQLAGWKKEQDYGFAVRVKALAKLPAGAVTVVDQAYVEKPLQGMHPASNQTLDLYVPPGKGPFPLIVWFHGGAWKGGSKEPQGAELAMRWLPEGFALASVNYRFLTDKATHPSLIEDSNAALFWLRAKAELYHLDAKNVGVIGASAGSHIAGMFAMTEGSGKYRYDGPAVKAAVLWCGFYDMTKETGGWGDNGFVVNPRDDFSWIYPDRKYDPEIAKAISPVYLLEKASPPVFLAHGEKDDIAPIRQSEMFAAALEKSGRQFVFKRYPDYDHNLFKADVLADSLEFFKKYLISK